MSKIVKPTKIDSQDFSDQVLSPKLAEIEKNLEIKFNLKLGNLEKNFDEKMDNKETKTAEILAIFITLFTFISVNVNIFTKVADVYTAIWFMLLMTACSVIILSFLFSIINSKKEWKTWIALLVALGFVAFLIVITISSKWNPKLNQVILDNKPEKLSK